MRTPTKRSLPHDDGSLPTTPRSSKRLRGAQTTVPLPDGGKVVAEVVKEEPTGTPERIGKSGKSVKEDTSSGKKVKEADEVQEATTPSKDRKKPKETPTSEKKAQPETPAKKAKDTPSKRIDSRDATIATKVTVVNGAGNPVQTAVATQAHGWRTSAVVNSAASPEPEITATSKTTATSKATASSKPTATSKPTTTSKPTATSKPAAKPKAKRGLGKQPAADMPPLAARALGSQLRIGAHVSAAGGVQNSVGNAAHIGANAFALFLKSQRRWANPPLPAAQATDFIAGCTHHAYDAAAHVVPHGSYLVNLAQPDADKAAQAYDGFIDDLRRCETLGIRLYNFHPGSTVGAPRPDALRRIAEQLNRAHAETTSVVTLLENMAAAGNTIGGTWADLGTIMAQVTDKSRVGVCLDTCHAFAAGHDLRSPAALSALLDALEGACGPGALRALHVNDSKAPLGSHRDLHANIGTGYLGLRAFHALVNEPRVWGLPMVLETPIDRPDAAGKSVEDRGVWAREIKLLEGLVGMDVASAEFGELERTLAREGEAERGRIGTQVDKKKAKDQKGKRGQKATSEDDSESE